MSGKRISNEEPKENQNKKIKLDKRNTYKKYPKK